MVDESGVETVKDENIVFLSTSTSDCGVRNIDGFARVEHPTLGVVTVRFTKLLGLDSRRSVQEQESDFRTLVERCIKSLEHVEENKMLPAPLPRP